MPNEIPDSDAEIKDEFDALIREEEAKEFSREKIQKALWGFEALVQDNKITPETTFDETLRVVRGRIKELRQTVANAKDVTKSSAEDNEATEFHQIAEEESERANRLLNYLEEAELELMRTQILNMNFHYIFKDIQRKLENKLERMEKALEYDEQKKRKGE